MHVELYELVTCEVWFSIQHSGVLHPSRYSHHTHHPHGCGARQTRQSSDGQKSGRPVIPLVFIYQILQVKFFVK